MKKNRGIYLTIYNDKDSLLLCTGLNLKEISEVLNSGKGIEEALKEKGEKYLDRYLTWKKYKELTLGEGVS